MGIDIKNIGVVQQLRNSKEVSDELKEQAINYIETLQTLVNQLSLHDVSDSLPVVCTMEDERGELANGCRISIKYAGEMITEQAKKLKAFGEFIDEYNSNYR